MNSKQVSEKAALWAYSQLHSPYSQAKRTQEGVFDCSSLVARAYAAQGKRWRYGGSIPTSMYEVYDDDFELLWPESYSEIGKRFGGNSAIALAKQSGDLQFICTDTSTKRSNKITHVAMVLDTNRIIHARGTRYGVCTNSINLYSNKICAIIRYNPQGPLRKGMCGWRTLGLQQKLNANGADITEDGEYGERTLKAVIAMQQRLDMKPTGVIDDDILGQFVGDTSSQPLLSRTMRVIGNNVNVRLGPGIEYGIAFEAHKGDVFQVLDSEGWTAITHNGAVYWISNKYIDA